MSSWKITTRSGYYHLEAEEFVEYEAGGVEHDGVRGYWSHASSGSWKTYTGALNGLRRKLEEDAEEGRNSDVKVVIGGYAYLAPAGTEIGDRFVLPSSFVPGSEGRIGTVAQIGSDYDGPLKHVLTKIVAA